MTGSSAPDGALTVVVRLGAGIVAAVTPQAVEGIRDRVAAEYTRLLQRLGIPGGVRAEVLADVATAAEVGDGSPPFRLVISGRPCWFPNDVVLQAFAYSAGTASVPASLPEDLPVDAVAGWVALVCREAAAQAADLLLTKGQARAYCAGHGLDVEAPGEFDRVHDALRQVVALGRSIADGDAVRNVLRVTGPADTDELGETLAAALSNPRLAIRMEPASLRQLTWDHRADGPQLFQLLREGLFTELGLALPALHLHSDPTLASGGFAVDLDDLPGLPQIGLTPGTVLVNDTPERLDLLRVEGTSCLVPALSQRASIVSQDHAAMLEAAGLTTWDQLGFLVLSLAGAVRGGGYRWIDRPTVDLLLGKFALMFPEAERAARACVPLGRLTLVLRDLLRDNLSIRNLRRILGVLTDAELNGALLADEGQAVDVVRTALRDEIGFRARRGTATVTAYLLDPELEAEAAAGVDDRRGRRLAGALRRELATLPPGVRPPVVLTRRPLRTQVRAAVQPEFPRVRVLSYEDLPPQANVQPIARIFAD